ncbi:OmpH family outer membrane protein [Brumimicrobium oceani]|uniref:OmpH family outer membrane protein n=1 Tax=Brumimicrobium oceani TaxID=2100725 RepID=A0A2U2X0M8_9FLAO|nr:OmpH family outer membrane protein [Brumimicrobium oceani]PWH81331.1 hypothetical protein DIT68_15460 [Brumimicrobium oceani]
MKKLMLILVMAVTTLGAAYGQSSMAHVNTQKVLDTMPSRKNAMTELENFERRAVKELQETQQKLQGDYTKLQQEKASMSPTAYKFEEERLMKKSQEFQTRQQELDEQIQILSQELNAPILKTVQDAVAKVSKTEKVDYVIDESSLLYSGGRDITMLVIKEVLRVEREAAAKATDPK